MSMVDTIMAMVGAVRPDIADKARDVMKNVSMDENGLRDFVQQQGGKAFLDEAERFANSRPAVKAAFNKFGINPHNLRDTVEKTLSHSSESSKTAAKKPTASEFRNRLDKMK